MGYQEDFVKQMLPYAVAVGDKYGLDPITIITQAVQETGWGQEVAGNNYFGVKSHGRPGGIMVTTHEDYGNGPVKEVHSFRQYGSMYESVEDYAQFLVANPRYANAFKVSGYADQLKTLAAAGYATDKNYSTKLLQVAESVRKRVGPLPPGSIPNVVGTQLDVTNPGGIDLTRLLKQAPVPRDRFEGDAARAKRSAQAPKPRPQEEGTVARNKRAAQAPVPHPYEDRIKAEMNEVAKAALAKEMYPSRKLPAIPKVSNQGTTFAGEDRAGPQKPGSTKKVPGQSQIERNLQSPKGMTILPKLEVQANKPVPQSQIERNPPSRVKEIGTLTPTNTPGVFRISGTNLAGSTQLPKDVRPNVTVPNLDRIAETLPSGSNAKSLGFTYAREDKSAKKSTGSSNQNIREQRAEQNAIRRTTSDSPLTATQDAVKAAQEKRQTVAPKPVATSQASSILDVSPKSTAKAQEPEFDLLKTLGFSAEDPLGLNSMFSSIDSMFGGGKEKNGSGGGSMFSSGTSSKLSSSQIAAANANSQNHNSAALAAINSGSKSYTGSDGGLQPTTAMNGNVRNTYGD